MQSFKVFLKAPYVGSATSLLFSDSDSQTLILWEVPLLVKGKQKYLWVFYPSSVLVAFCADNLFLVQNEWGLQNGSC